MKNALLLFLAMHLIVLSSNAQSRGMLSLSLGPAIPVGKYASKSATDSSSGLANIGPIADISYRHLFDQSRFGWMASLRGRLNGVNKNATLAPFEAEFPGYQWSIKNGRWTTVAVLFGGYYEWPLTSKLSLSANVGLGVAKTWSPKQSITGFRDLAGYGVFYGVQADLPSVSTISFTALAGLGMRYQWNKRWSFLATIEDTWLTPTFKNVFAVLEKGINTASPSTPAVTNGTGTGTSFGFTGFPGSFTMPMSSVDIKLGVGWAL